MFVSGSKLKTIQQILDSERGYASNQYFHDGRNIGAPVGAVGCCSAVVDICDPRMHAYHQATNTSSAPWMKGMQVNPSNQGCPNASPLHDTS
jgi:hypothetical protein